MTPHYSVFDHMHVRSEAWIDLQELFREAEALLPSGSYQPSLPAFGTPDYLSKAEQALRDSWIDVSSSVSASFSDFYLGGDWPADMTDQQIYWARAAIKTAERFIWTFAPTPEDFTIPTAIPFPAQPLRNVALWLCVEWWATKGGMLFANEVIRKINNAQQDETDDPLQRPS